MDKYESVVVAKEKLETARDNLRNKLEGILVDEATLLGNH
jgi:hypothetical protein